MYIVNGKGSLIRLIAGFFVVTSAVLSRIHSPYWLYFTGLVGIMLMISATTGFCPMEYILRALKIEEKVVCNKETSAKLHL